MPLNRNGKYFVSNVEKNENFNLFLLQLIPDEKGLDFGEVYGLYVSLVEKEFRYAPPTVRRKLDEKYKRVMSNEKNRDVFVSTYKVTHRLFKYLEEQSERGETARKIFDSMIKNKKAYNHVGAGSVYIGKDVVRMEAEETKKAKSKRRSSYTSDNNVGYTRKNNSQTFMLLNTSIKSLEDNHLPVYKHKILGMIHKEYDEIRLPVYLFSSFDMYARECILSINHAKSRTEINSLYQRFIADIEVLKHKAKIKE